MFPHERSLVKQLSGKPFALIGVNSDSDITEPQRLTEEGTVTWRSFWNGPDGTQGPISTEWGVRGWPTIYILDADGVIRYANSVRGAGIDRAIEELLGEMGHEVTIAHEDLGESGD